MSVINKKPFINQVLESMTTEEKETLRSLINGSVSDYTFRSLLPYSSNKLSTSDKGVKKVLLEVSKTRAQGSYLGYLVYNEQYCVLIAYSAEKNQQLTLLHMSQEAGSLLWSYQIVTCELSIVELRSELDDVLEGGGGEETKVILEFDTFADFPEVGEAGKLYIDLEHGDIYVYNEGEYLILGGGSQEGLVALIERKFKEACDYADSLVTKGRTIADLDVSCPPISYGVVGGEAEISTGEQKLKVLYGNTTTGVQSAKLISRGKNQFQDISENRETDLKYTDVISGEEYKIFGLPSGFMISEYDADKHFIQNGMDQDHVDNYGVFTVSENTRYIIIEAEDNSEVTEDTEIMLYITFGEAYDEPYEEPRVEEIVLPNLVLRSVGDVRDEIYSTGGGIRRISNQGEVLAEPVEITDVENPGWDEDIFIDNYGTLMFVDSNGDEIETEQPYSIIYKADLIEFLDSTYAKAKGNASDIALESDIVEGKVVAGLAEGIHTDRVIDDLDISCPPITYGVVGGEAEISTGIQELTQLFGKTIYDEDNAIYKSSKSAKLISRGKNQFTGFDEFIDVLSSEQYRIFTNLPSGLLITEYNKDKEETGWTDFDLDGELDVVVGGSGSTINPNVIDVWASNTRYIKLVPADPTEVNDNTYVMMYMTFGESYNEPYEEPNVSEVELPNITLRSFDDVRDEVYASGGGIRRVGILEVTEDNLIQVDEYNFKVSKSGYNFFKFIPQNVIVDYSEFNSSDTYFDIIVESNNAIIGTGNLFTDDERDYIGVYLNPSDSHTMQELIEAFTSCQFIFKLETEEEITEEQNPGWEETLFVDNYGTLMFQDSEGEEVEVEQPYEILYHADLKEFLDSAFVRTQGDADDIALVSELENGDCIPAISEQANNLTPYGSESGVRDNTAFLFQTSGGDSDIGSKAYLEKLTGKSYAINQLVKTDASHINNDVTVAFDEETGIFTLNGSTNYSINLSSEQCMLKRGGHKILMKFEALSTPPSPLKPYIGSVADDYYFDDSILGEGIYYKILTLREDDDSSWIYIRHETFGTAITFSNFKCRFQVFDLTTMFGAGKEPEDAATFLKVFPGYIPYNEGEIVSAKSSKYEIVGYNACDGELDVGYYIDTDTGEEVYSGDITYAVTKNFIKVVPGQQYSLEFSFDDENAWDYTGIAFYDANKTFINWVEDNNSIIIPSNCYYVRIEIACTSNIDLSKTHICFHLTWDGSKTGYEKYYKKEYKLPNIELRRARDAYDELSHDGTLIRRVGIVDLGTLEWNYYGNDVVFYSDDTMNLAKGQEDPDVISNLLCGGIYKSECYNDTATGNFDLAIAIYDDGALYISDSRYQTAAALKEALSGVYLLYELVTPTIEQSESYEFQEITDIDDFGTQEFDSPVPQGNEFFYPADYKAFIDSLGSKLDYNADKLDELIKKPKNLNVVNQENKMRNFVRVSINEDCQEIYANNTLWIFTNPRADVKLGSIDNPKGNATASQCYGTKKGNKVPALYRPHGLQIFNDLPQAGDNLPYGHKSSGWGDGDGLMSLSELLELLMGVTFTDAQVEAQGKFPYLMNKKLGHGYKALGVSIPDSLANMINNYQHTIFNRCCVPIQKAKKRYAANSNWYLINKMMIKFGATNFGVITPISDQWIELLIRIEHDASEQAVDEVDVYIVAFKRDFSKRYTQLWKNTLHD